LPATSTMTAWPLASKWVNSLMLRNLADNFRIVNQLPSFASILICH
jgi:hypothetical protein